MRITPVPPAPPDLSGQLIAQGLRLNAPGKFVAAQPMKTTPAPAPGPCPKCRDKGWVFVSILDGTTRRCDCEEVF